MSLRRPSQNNNPNVFGWSQGHKGSSVYSSKRSLLPDHLMDAREVTHQANARPFHMQGEHRGLKQSLRLHDTPHLLHVHAFVGQRMCACATPPWCWHVAPEQKHSRHKVLQCVCWRYFLEAQNPFTSPQMFLRWPVRYLEIVLCLCCFRVFHSCCVFYFYFLTQ